MSTPRFRFTRLVAGEKRRAASLAAALGEEVAGRTWLFVSPHDDDLCLGAGLLMQAAAAEGATVQVLIVTDGRLGYCREEQQATIVDIRRAETEASFALLGVPRERIVRLDYPDDNLTPHLGRRRAAAGDPSVIAGYAGLQNAFTHWLRRLRPSRVLLPTPTDLHPDHRHTHSELMISLFHASGAVWPELGEPLPAAPNVSELAVYCDFLSPPDLQVEGDAPALAAKLASIEAYRSQEQIAALVASVRAAGPVEYLRQVDFRLYSPTTYQALFA